MIFLIPETISLRKKKLFKENNNVKFGSQIKQLGKDLVQNTSAIEGETMELLTCVQY